MPSCDFFGGAEYCSCCECGDSKPAITQEDRDRYIENQKRHKEEQEQQLEENRRKDEIEYKQFVQTHTEFNDTHIKCFKCNKRISMKYFIAHFKRMHKDKSCWPTKFIECIPYDGKVESYETLIEKMYKHNNLKIYRCKYGKIIIYVQQEI